MPRSPVARASRLLLGALLLGALVIAHAPRVEGGDAASAVQHGGGPVGGVLRKRLGLDDFYQRCLDLDGLPILSSPRPPDVALREAAWVIAHMLRGRPDVLRTLAERGIRVCVLAHDEMLTDVPECSSLQPRKWWDYRARGLGTGPQRPVVVCAEENLLAYDGDPYAGECILIHEFAHAVDREALRVLDPTFEKRLAKAFAAACKVGRWSGTYARTDKEEYWAEGVQSWFGANRRSDAQHPLVDSRAALRRYDPPLAALIAEGLGDNDWVWTPASRREGKAHLAIFDRSRATTFHWPPGLEAWFWRYEWNKRSGHGWEPLEALPAAASPHSSPPTRTQTRILFVNRTGHPLRLWWLDYGGTPKPYGTVGAGTDAERVTSFRQVWIVTTEAGAEVARFLASRHPGRAVLK